jgi:hypothetical protein
MGTWSLSSGWGVALTTHSPIERRGIRKSRGTLLPLCALMACCRVTFTFTNLRYAACEYLLGLLIALKIRAVYGKPLK